MYNQTKETIVTGEVQIWAIPRTAWEIEQSEEENPTPFKFVLRTSSPYQDGAVKLDTQEVKLVLPGGIDLLTAAVATLREQMETEEREHRTRLGALQKQVDALAMLEHLQD